MSYNRKQGDLIDRSNADLDNHPDIKPLFPDPAAEAIRYYKKTGIYPINHGMVIKRAVFERNPWAVINILKAFNQANDIADAERREHVAYHLETGLCAAGLSQAPGDADHHARPQGQSRGARNGGAIFQPARPDAAAHADGRTVRGERVGFMKLRGA